MTSELRVDNLKGSTTGGSINVLGEGTSATTNLQQGLTKAWCKFQGSGTIANDDSFNVSGLTDNGTGDYTVAIDNDMANDDYSTSVHSSENHSAVYNAANTFACQAQLEYMFKTAVIRTLMEMKLVFKFVEI